MKMTDIKTCGDMKQFYQQSACCGTPSKVLEGVAACPYNFDKPACSVAEPQAPRDLTDGAPGEKTPKAATLTDAQAQVMPLANVHFHLGGEHKTASYSDGTDSVAYDAVHGRRLSGSRRLADEVRPGWMCSTSGMTAEQLAPYSFSYCKGQTQVGKSYEVHYVHSSAGFHPEDLDGADSDLIADGLGGAANGRGQLNPMIVVQAQVYQIVNGGQNVSDLLHGWTVVGHSNSVMYPGSTTGPSHNNQVCSPYAITWHVDKECHQVSPEAFDRLCKDMNELYHLESDLYPHGSRKLVDSRWVVKPEYVLPLA